MPSKGPIIKKVFLPKGHVSAFRVYQTSSPKADTSLTPPTKIALKKHTNQKEHLWPENNTLIKGVQQLKLEMPVILKVLTREKKVKLSSEQPMEHLYSELFMDDL